MFNAAYRIRVIEQKIYLLLRGRRQSTLGSFTLCSKMAFVTMIFSQILHLRRSLSGGNGSLHGSTRKRIDGSVGFLTIGKLLDHLLLGGNSSGTTNVDNIMHTALLDAAVAEAPLDGSFGIAEVIHVQLVERQGTISAIKQSIDLNRRLRGRRHGALGSFTPCSTTANGRIMSSQILASMGI